MAARRSAFAPVRQVPAVAGGRAVHSIFGFLGGNMRPLTVPVEFADDDYVAGAGSARKLLDKVGATEKIRKLNAQVQALGTDAGLLPDRLDAISAAAQALYPKYAAHFNRCTRAGSTMAEAEDSALAMAKADFAASMAVINLEYPQKYSDIKEKQHLGKAKVKVEGQS